MSERVALLVLSALLAAAVIVIFRLSVEHMRMKETLQTLRVIRKNLTCSRLVPHHKTEMSWESHGGKCYHFSSRRATWEESRCLCQHEGGDLVKVDSPEEQSFLEERLTELMKYPDDKFWIGLSDSEEEGKWLWVDGAPLTPSLSFWHRGEPDDWRMENGDGEDCVRMGEKNRVSHNWYDRFCETQQRHICEKDLDRNSWTCD